MNIDKRWCCCNSGIIWQNMACFLKIVNYAISTSNGQLVLKARSKNQITLNKYRTQSKIGGQECVQ